MGTRMMQINLTVDRELVLDCPPDTLSRLLGDVAAREAERLVQEADRAASAEPETERD